MANESDPLLSGSGSGHNRSHAESKAVRNSRLREIGLFAWALIATAAVIVVAIWTQHEQQTKHDHNTPATKRNLVFMVSDGMGPASLSLTRSYRQHVEDLHFGDILTLDKHFWGTSRTRSNSSLVTDSAAGATAFSCGKKTYNGAISTLPNHDPCGTVLEAAKRAGYHTGLVVTTKIEDATPACFNSHVVLREMEDEIALQQIGEGVLGRTVDLMLGGGRCNYLPKSAEGSCRADDTDVVKIAKEKHNWTYTDDRAGFDALKGGNNVKLPFLGLFAPTDIPFEIDRRNHNDVYPSLSEMAKTALRALEKATEKSDKGFFIMIEGSRIDHAGHINDPAAQVHEVLEYDKTFRAVLDFIKQSKTETVLVATSDHETGGLATAIQEPGHLPVYNWFPKVLANATASAEWLHAKLNAHLVAESGAKKNIEKLKKYINDELIVRGLGISNASDKEITAIAEHPENALVLFSALISLRAHIGWSTHGHTAVDVNIYSSGGPRTENLRGNVENTDVGKYLREYLEVDVDAITSELQDKMGKAAVQDTGMEALDEVWSLGNKYHAIEN